MSVEVNFEVSVCLMVVVSSYELSTTVPANVCQSVPMILFMMPMDSSSESVIPNKLYVSFVGHCVLPQQ